MLNEVIGLKERNSLYTVEREAVRAIIMRNNKILMIASSMEDYKLPGGGVEQGENHEAAVTREVEEETGFTVTYVKDYLGKIVERRLDLYKKDQVFEMTSHYYICEIDEKQGALRLDEYEKDLNFHPVWLQISDAIKTNEKLLSERKDKDSGWLYRELFVLKEISKL